MKAFVIALAVTMSPQALPDPARAIDEAFAYLGDQHWRLVTAQLDLLTANLEQGPGEQSAEVARCLGLLTPMTEALSTTTLRREMSLFARLDPNSRIAAFEVAQLSAREQASELVRRQLVLEASEGECVRLAVYVDQRAKVMALSARVQEIIEVIVRERDLSAAS